MDERDFEAGEGSVAFLIVVPTLLTALFLLVDIGLTGMAVSAGQATTAKIAHDFADLVGEDLPGVSVPHAVVAAKRLQACDGLRTFGGLQAAGVDQLVNYGCGGGGSGWVVIESVSDGLESINPMNEGEVVCVEVVFEVQGLLQEFAGPKVIEGCAAVRTRPQR